MATRKVRAYIDRGNGIRAFRDETIIDDQGRKGQVPASVANYIAAEEFGNGLLNRTRLTCTALPISVADDAGVAQYGGAGKIYDFPQGSLLNMGAVVDGSLTMGDTGTIIATFNGDVALGTAAASTGATLVGTEADLMQSVALTTAVSTVANSDAQSVATALTESGARWHDGTSTAKDMYLNFVIDDDATHTAATGTFTGVIEFVWMILGDY